jgi:peptidylprolyl isomerase
MKRLLSKTHPIVYFDIAIDGASRGRVALELFETTLPVTSRNFRAIANGYKSKILKQRSLAGPSLTSVPLTYRNTKIHRIVPGFMIQGGDVLYSNGFGTTSIYGKTFVDEHFGVEHDRPGILSMANAGPDTNGSQFFITTAPAPHLNGKHVAFGQVVAGFDLVKEIESLGSPDGCPRAQVWITDSGELNEAGFLAEVQYERLRIQERLEVEREKDVEELRLYNECVRSGIEYVPRALRDRIRAEQQARERIQEIEDFSSSMVQQSLASDVEKLAAEAKALQEASITTFQQKKTKTPANLSQEIFQAIRKSKGGSKTLVDSLEELRRDKGLSGKSELARFTEKLLKRAPTTFTSYMDRFDQILEHSAYTPAPLTAELILQRVKSLRLKARGHEEKAGEDSNEKTDPKLESELFNALKIIERHPKVHGLSPRISPAQSSLIESLLDELESLKPYDDPTTAHYAHFVPRPSNNLKQKASDQIAQLVAQKQGLEEVLKPFAASGHQMPYNPLTTSFQPPKSTGRKKAVKN